MATTKPQRQWEGRHIKVHLHFYFLFMLYIYIDYTTNTCQQWPQNHNDNKRAGIQRYTCIFIFYLYYTLIQLFQTGFLHDVARGSSRRRPPCHINIFTYARHKNTLLVCLCAWHPFFSSMKTPTLMSLCFWCNEEGISSLLWWISLFLTQQEEIPPCCVLFSATPFFFFDIYLIKMYIS